MLAAVENDPHAAATYSANFGAGHVHVGSIENVHTDDVPSVDVVIGGPPCQGFSNLGRRAPDDPRNSLWRHYVRLLRRATPDYFVLENVPGFLHSPEWQLLQDESVDGALRQYELIPHVLNAVDFGAAQRRRRVIVVGRRRDMPRPPDPRAIPTAARRNVGDALAPLPREAPVGDLPARTLDASEGGVPGTFLTSELHLDRNLTELVRTRIRHVPYGGNRRDIPEALLPDCWRTHESTTDVMGRLSWEKPSVTIRTEFVKPEKGRYLHPTEDRPITLAEGALLQGFPLDFAWCGTRTSIGRQIGNAVPIPLATALADSLAQVYR
ncbi:DNA cytosine methyltransferase [Pseudonocardia alni subsp. carboxydivorans]